MLGVEKMPENNILTLIDASKQQIERICPCLVESSTTIRDLDILE